MSGGICPICRVSYPEPHGDGCPAEWKSNGSIGVFRRAVHLAGLVRGGWTSKRTAAGKLRECIEGVLIRPERLAARIAPEHHSSPRFIKGVIEPARALRRELDAEAVVELLGPIVRARYITRAEALITLGGSDGLS